VAAKEVKKVEDMVAEVVRAGMSRGHNSFFIA